MSEEHKSFKDTTLDDYVPTKEEILFFGHEYILNLINTNLKHWSTKQLIYLCAGKVKTRTQAYKKIIDHVRLNMKRIVNLEAKSQFTGDTQR
jgi:hypothetical protein